MEHKINYHFYIRCNIIDEIELDPYEYLDYKNKEEVKDAIWYDIIDIVIPENTDYDIDHADYKIPESFWEEWRKLKENE